MSAAPACAGGFGCGLQSTPLCRTGERLGGCGCGVGVGVGVSVSGQCSTGELLRGSVGVGVGCSALNSAALVRGEHQQGPHTTAFHHCTPPHCTARLLRCCRHPPSRRKPKPDPPCPARLLLPPLLPVCYRYAGDEEGRGGIYNFVTKRGICLGERSKISWTQVGGWVGGWVGGCGVGGRGGGGRAGGCWVLSRVRRGINSCVLLHRLTPSLPHRYHPPTHPHTHTHTPAAG